MRTVTGIILLFAVILLTANSIYAEDIPEGFGDLPSEETSLIDVYYGKLNLGSALATYNEDDIHFKAPEVFLKKIPNLRNIQKIADLLRKNLPTHSHRVCTKKPKKGCGYLRTKNVAIILNPIKYRAHLFINQNFFLPSERPKPRFVKAATANAAYINVMQTEYASEPSQRAISLNNRGIGTKNHFSFVNDWSTNYEDVFGEKTSTLVVLARDLFVNYNQNRLNYRAGLIQSQGTVLIPSFSVFGLKTSTSDTLLNNSNELSATPISVDLNAPSYVDIYRQNNLIGTQYFMPGIHYLRTTNFPQGAYELTIRIRDIYNNERTIHQFFVKTQKVPLLQYPDYYLTMGRIRTNDAVTNANGLVGPAENLIINAGSYFRLSPLWAMRASILGTKPESLVSTGIVRLLPTGDIGISSLYSNKNSYGLGSDVNLRLWRIINFNFIYRYLKLSTEESQLLEGQENFDTNLSTGLSMNLTPNLQSRISYSLSHSRDDSNTQYNLGLGLNWAAYQTGTTAIDMGFNCNINNTETQLELTLTLLFNVNHWRINLNNRNSSGLPIQGTQNASRLESISSISAGYSTKTFGGSGTYRTGPSYRSWGVANKIKTSYLRMNNRFSTIDTPGITTNQGNGSLFSTMIINTHGAIFTPQEPKAGVTVHIKSENDAEFTLMNKSSNLGVVNSNTPTFISLSPYQTYHFSLSANGTTPYSIGPISQISKTVHEGNVAVINFTAAPAFTLITTFTYSDGTPVKDMDIEGGVDFSQTDSEGMASVMVRNKQTLTLTNGIESCEAHINNLEPEDGMVFTDNIICK